MTKKRVVITGTGVVSPIGVGTDTFTQNLMGGQSGIGRIEQLPSTAVPGHVGGEIKEFTASSARKSYLRGQRKSIKVMCREIQLGVASAALAVESSGLDLETIDHTRIGVDFGANQMFSPAEVLKEACRACVDDPATGFNFEKWGRTGMPRLEPLWLLKYLPNMPACHIAILADAQGPNNSLTQAEASGNLAMGEAFRIVQRGSADMMIAGATGACIHEVKSLHAVLWDQLADSSEPPDRWCRPFDKHRTGQVIGEAACSFLFEEEAHAQARGATVHASVLGAGSSCVRTPDGQPNNCQALVNAMRFALKDAAIEPGDVGHIHGHGAATRDGDREEAAAIAEVFGRRSTEIPVTALKSFVGNSGAGSGPLELAASLVSLCQDLVPVTLNYETPDPECALNVVAGKPRATQNKIVLNVNVTALGLASALVAAGA